MIILLACVIITLFNEKASNDELQPPNGYGSKITSEIFIRFKYKLCAIDGKIWICDVIYLLLNLSITLLLDSLFNINRTKFLLAFKILIIYSSNNGLNLNKLCAQKNIIIYV